MTESRKAAVDVPLGSMLVFDRDLPIPADSPRAQVLLPLLHHPALHLHLPPLHLLALHEL